MFARKARVYAFIWITFWIERKIRDESRHRLKGVFRIAQPGTPTRSRFDLNLNVLVGRLFGFIKINDFLSDISNGSLVKGLAGSEKHFGAQNTLPNIWTTSDMLTFRTKRHLFTVVSVRT